MSVQSFKKFYQLQLLTEEKIDQSRWNEYMSTEPSLKAAIEVLKKLESLGGEAYIVGGAVRDIVLGDKPHDIDIATNVPVDKISKVFKTHDIGQSRDFGIVTINHEGENFEVANFRTDGVYKDGRKPESVKIVLDFKTDAGRRDITINSMGIDKDGNIIDHFGGQEDIKNKVIRTVGNPNDRLEEDRLRMMRIVRFSSKLGFDIDPKTKEALKDFAPKIKDISIERITDELLKNASYGGEKFAKAIETLDEVGILKEILPEVTKLKEFEHTETSHPEGGVWRHTLEALKTSGSKDPLVNLGILLHDVGKALTRSYNEKGIVQYLGHARDGADLVQEIGKRLRLSTKQIEALIFMVLNHMKIHDVLKMSNSKIAGLIRNENFDALIEVMKADAGARGRMFKKEDINKIMDKIADVKDKMKPTEWEQLKKLINGRKIMEMLDLKPGPKVGEIINSALEWAVDNDVKDAEQIYSWIKENFKKE